MLAQRVRELAPDVEVLVGVPTLGLCVAPIVVQALGLGAFPLLGLSLRRSSNFRATVSERYVPLGYSLKFWYCETLSAGVSSITSPGVGLKRVYLDPNLLPLVVGKRVVIIDDAVSSGRTLKATWDLLEGVGCKVEGVGVVMRQGTEWRALLGEEKAGRVVSVLESPLLRAMEEGWGLR